MLCVFQYLDIFSPPHLQHCKTNISNPTPFHLQLLPTKARHQEIFGEELLTYVCMYPAHLSWPHSTPAPGYRTRRRRRCRPVGMMRTIVRTKHISIHHSLPSCLPDLIPKEKKRKEKKKKEPLSYCCCCCCNILPATVVSGLLACFHPTEKFCRLSGTRGKQSRGKKGNAFLGAVHLFS